MGTTSVDQSGQITTESPNARILSDLEHKKVLLESRIQDRQEDVKDIETIYEEVRKKVYEISEQNIHRLITELETGGNIRFEEGKVTDKWFASCVDLLKSRFQSENMGEYGITDIQVTRVTRVHNRFLRNQFEEKLEQLVDLSEKHFKRSLEYLFYGMDPMAPTEMFRAMEEGFRTPNEYASFNLAQCVPLVNSLSVADLPRIRHFFCNETAFAQLRSSTKSSTLKEIRMNKELALAKGLVQVPSGYVLICKVFLSKAIHDIYNPIFNPDKSPSQIWAQEPIDQANLNGAQSMYRVKENDTKQKMWFIFDPGFVLPEYVIEYEYVTNNGLTPQTPGEVNEEFNKLCNKVVSERTVLAHNYLKMTGQSSHEGNIYIYIYI